MSAATSMLEAALAYAARGLPVFPCGGDKKPLTVNGYKNATKDPKIIEEAWSLHPDAMIGIPTGQATDIFVVDIDIKSRDGFATLKKFRLDLSGVPQATTPSGGAHYYFRLSGMALKNTAGKLGPGLDTRGNGGYIIIPPSRPDPAKPGYTWTNSIDLLAAPVVPAEIVEALKSDGKPTPAQELEAEAERVRNAPPGARNDILNRACFKLARLVQSGKLVEDEVRDALTKAALDCGLEAVEIAKTLDSALVAGKAEARSKRDKREAEKAGHSLHLDDIEPWDEPVDGLRLVNGLVADLRRYVITGDFEVDAIALWVLHTYAHEIALVSPRLGITSPTPGCGKTTLLDWLTGVTPRALEACNVSPAAVYRVIEAVRPTLLIDEADSFLRDNEELRGVLNSGHRRGGHVIRTVGDDFEPRAFSTFAPCAIALLGRLPATLHDRAIHIRLTRRLRSESVMRFKRTAGELARKCRRWTIDHTQALQAAEPDIPEALANRQADNWFLLFAITDLIGSDWPGRARRAAKGLLGSVDDTASLSVQLLADIGDIFQQTNLDQIASSDLIGYLISDPEKPWQEYGRRRKPISQRQLAALLRPFTILSGTLHFTGGGSLKGYRLDQFTDAFGRYLT